jgi:hypothetical protein
MKHESKEVYNRKDEHNDMIETMDSIVGGWGWRVFHLEQALQRIKAVAGSNCWQEAIVRIPRSSVGCAMRLCPFAMMCWRWNDG